MKSVSFHFLPRPYIISAAVLLGTVLLSSALLAIFWFDPSQHSFYPQCLLHSLTGLNCAGCGSLRALHHLLHGDFLPAFRSNALLVIAVLATAVIGIGWLRGKWLAAELGKWFFRPAIVLGGLGITMVFAVLRNLSFAPFAWLNP